MKRKLIHVTAIAMALTSSAAAQIDDSGKCGNEMLKGAYGTQLSGTRPAPFVPPGKPGFAGQMEQVSGIVIQVFDSKGSFTQTDNLKGAISGFVPDRPGRGTYVVNPDCSMIQTVQPAPGVTIVTRSVILDGGKEIRGFTVSPDEVNLTILARPIK